MAVLPMASDGTIASREELAEIGFSLRSIGNGGLCGRDAVNVLRLDESDVTDLLRIRNTADRPLSLGIHAHKRPGKELVRPNPGETLVGYCSLRNYSGHRTPL